MEPQRDASQFDRPERSHKKLLDKLLLLSSPCNSNCNYGSSQPQHLQDDLDLNINLELDSVRELEVGDGDLHWNWRSQSGHGTLNQQ